mgnify:CR=1 FL=1
MGAGTVLIDTWWNVNYVSFQLYLPRIGFNRYMVECELYDKVIASFPALVLIDTWWNVNTKICFFQFLDEIVLIDTWWNVNCFR